MAQCFFPIKIKNPIWCDFEPFNQDFLEVPCGKCEACLTNKRREWTYRVNEEFKNSSSAHFITLTYSDENLYYEAFKDKFGVYHTAPIPLKRDVQLFFKRLRKSISPYKIRYYAVSEYGTNFLRPHYHIILFNFPCEFDVFKAVDDAWQKGFVSVSQVNGARINYCTSYLFQRSDLPDYLPKPFVLTSRRPGLGLCYLTDKNIDFHRDNKTLKTIYPDGVKRSLPRYYRDKIFTKPELYEIAILTYQENKPFIDKLRKADEEWFRSDSLQPSPSYQYRKEFIRKFNMKKKKGKKL